MYMLQDRKAKEIWQQYVFIGEVWRCCNIYIYCYRKQNTGYTPMSLTLYVHFGCLRENGKRPVLLIGLWWFSSGFLCLNTHHCSNFQDIGTSFLTPKQNLTFILHNNMINIVCKYIRYCRTLPSCLSYSMLNSLKLSQLQYSIAELSQAVSATLLLNSPKLSQLLYCRTLPSCLSYSIAELSLAVSATLLLNSPKLSHELVCCWTLPSCLRYSIDLSHATWGNWKPDVSTL